MNVLKKHIGTLADSLCIRQARRLSLSSILIGHIPAETAGVGFVARDMANNFLGVIQVETGDLPKLTLFGIPEAGSGNGAPVTEALVICTDGKRKNIILSPDPSQPEGAKPVAVESHTLAQLWDRARISLAGHLLFDTGIPNNYAIKEALCLMIVAQRAHRKMESAFPFLKAVRNPGGPIVSLPAAAPQARA